jgi:hypothetical protein
MGVRVKMRHNGSVDAGQPVEPSAVEYEIVSGAVTAGGIAAN